MAIKAKLPAFTQDVMVDLETLGKRAGCQILSIGACYFQRGGPVAIGRTFYTACRTNRGHQERLGLHADADTLDWWSKQGGEAKKVLSEAKSPKAPTLRACLTQFNDFLAAADGTSRQVRVWGNGSDFDNAILFAAYAACGVKPGWEFYNSRCFRTWKSEFGDVRKPEFKGVKHHALGDAIHQAEHAHQIFRYLTR